MVGILSLTTPAETFEVRRSRYRKGPCRSSVEVELVAIVASESRDTVLLESPLSFRCCRYGLPHLGQFRMVIPLDWGFLKNGYLRWAETWNFCLHGFAKLPSHFVAASIDPYLKSLAFSCCCVVRFLVFEKFSVEQVFV